MKQTFKTLFQCDSPVIDSGTSSREYPAGLPHSEWQDGLTTAKCLPCPVLASLSARQAKEQGLLTSGTFGPPRSTSSVNSGPLSSLASRLQARTALLGSTLYRLTWKLRATPSGRQLPLLAASAHRISGKGSTSSALPWATPTTRDHKDGAECQNVPLNALLGRQVWLSSWPTPASKEAAGGEYSDPDKAMARALGPHANDLRDFAQMAGWTTPQAHDSTGRSATQKDLHGTKHGCACLGLDAQLSGWATPVVQQANGTPEAFLRRKKESMERGSQPMGLCLSDLNMQVQAYLPGPARLTACGRVLTGCSAGMPSGGRLSPLHSLWLMLGPLALRWLKAAERVERKPKRSSTRTRSPKQAPTATE